VFFLDEVLPNYDVKNRISTYTKEFPRKRKAQISQISKQKVNPNCQIFMISFSR
jgi:hypothetical protein